MSKLNYSQTKHLAKMIKIHSEKMKNLLQEIEIYREYVFKLADELLTLLKEAQKEEK